MNDRTRRATLAVLNGLRDVIEETGVLLADHDDHEDCDHHPLGCLCVMAMECEYAMIQSARDAGMTLVFNSNTERWVEKEDDPAAEGTYDAK